MSREICYFFHLETVFIFFLKGTDYFLENNIIILINFRWLIKLLDQMTPVENKAQPHKRTHRTERSKWGRGREEQIFLFGQIQNFPSTNCGSEFNGDGPWSRRRMAHRIELGPFNIGCWPLLLSQKTSQPN
jgi:hypothetical protein